MGGTAGRGARRRGMKLNLEFSAGEIEDFLLKFLSKGLFRMVSSQDPAVAARLVPSSKVSWR